MKDFVVRMTNTWKFSACEHPHHPITPSKTETIIVELCRHVLTISTFEGAKQARRRIYATEAVTLDGAMTFTIVANLPHGISDDVFFPAIGTAVAFEPPPSGRRRLRAVGTDWNSGRCHGWIFDAVER